MGDASLRARAPLHQLGEGASALYLLAGDAGPAVARDGHPLHAEGNELGEDPLNLSVAAVRGLQTPLPTELNHAWCAALNDAGISADNAILFTFPGRASPDGECAVYLRHGMTADVAGLDDELLHQLNDTASGCIHAYRVFLWSARSRGQQHSSGTNLSTRARSMPARKLRNSTT